MTRHYEIISGDGHLEVPPDLWIRHVPEQWLDRAPRLVRLPSGGDGWIVEGRPLLQTGQNLTGRGPVKWKGVSYHREDGTPVEGAGGAVQRLHEQDIDGIDAEILFPPVLATRFIEGIADREAYVAMNQAYNTFLAEDFCSVAPDRLIGTAAMPVSGIDDAIAELERVHRLGLRSVTLHEFPNGTGRPAPEDDRFWARLLELGVALSAHSNFGARSAADTNMANATTLADQGIDAALNQHIGAIVPMFCLTQLITSGVFDRFPELQLYFAEVNVAYLPAALYYIDRDYRVYNEWFQVPLARKPSEYVLDHVWFGAIQEHLALRMGEFFPVDRFMFGTDFPHSVGTFPDTRTYVKDAFAHLDAATRRKILVENPATFLGLDPDAAITETPDAG